MISLMLSVMFLVQGALGAPGLPLCVSDADCLDEFICHEHVCQNCIKCGLIFRMGTDCVSNLNDCGDCLPGYEDVSVTDYSAIKKPCRPLKKKVKMKQCINDNNCPPDYYCNEDSCIKCFECSLMNRLRVAGNCARGPNECGPCVMGYEELPVTTEENFKTCKEVFNNPINRLNVASGSVVTAAWLAIVLMTIFLIKTAYKKIKDHTSMKSESSQSAPPFQLNNVRNCEGYLFCQAVMQLPKFYQQLSSAPYYYKGEGGSSYDISKCDSLGPDENSSPPVPSSVPADSAQPQDGPLTSAAVCRDWPRIMTRTLSELPSFIPNLISKFFSKLNFQVSVVDSQEEQPVEVSSDSSENNPDLDAVGPNQTRDPEDPAKEPAENLDQN